MKYSVIILMMILGMASSLQGQDEPTPPAQIEFQVQDEPVIIQSFSAPLGGGFGGEGGVITLQATGDALGGGDAGGGGAAGGSEGGEPGGSRGGERSGWAAAAPLQALEHGLQGRGGLH